MTTPALTFQHVTKHYDTFAAGTKYALRDVSFQIPRGRTVAIVGRSGSGKSTLLHLAAGIDVPTEGRVTLDGQDLATMSDHDRTLLRRDHVGLVFQFFHLLTHLSVEENVALPALIAGDRWQSFIKRARDLLRRVGLADRAGDPVDTLSGGEMQRVAVCRALLRRPRLLLADEPTGNLDDEAGRTVMNLLVELAAEEQSTLAYVTHSPEIATLADETWELHSGQLRRA